VAADFQAGTATAGAVRVLVLEDAKGTRALFAQAEFRITQALADFVAAQINTVNSSDYRNIRDVFIRLVLYLKDAIGMTPAELDFQNHPLSRTMSVQRMMLCFPL
jgi:hypothetical protein